MLARRDVFGRKANDLVVAAHWCAGAMARVAIL
jgi:hypothetical protein